MTHERAALAAPEDRWHHLDERERFEFRCDACRLSRPVRGDTLTAAVAKALRAERRTVVFDVDL